LSLLVVEDDRADALLVEELIADANADIQVVWAQSMADAERALAAARPDCVLLDLNLPDANGISALDRIAKREDNARRRADRPDRRALRGLGSGVGCPGLPVKGASNPRCCAAPCCTPSSASAPSSPRSNSRQPDDGPGERPSGPRSASHAAPARRPGVDIVAQYRPSTRNAMLGGDFYDFVQTPDRTVHVMVGDVAGHGPDAAALGVALRIGWRALTFAGLRGNARMRQLERILRAESPGSGIFATVISVALAPDSLRFNVVRAGHPGMLLHGPNGVEWLEPPAGPALGLNGTVWPLSELELPEGHGLLLLTDGMFEGHPVRATSGSAKQAFWSWPARWRRCRVRIRGCADRWSRGASRVARWSDR
jgi:hypothetical protein